MTIGTSIAILIMMAAIPFVVASARDISNDTFDQHFGSLFEGLKPDRFSRLANFFMLLRRLIFSLTVVFLDTFPYLQVAIYNFSSLSYLSFLVHARPYSSLLMNRLEIFNETLILLTSYCLYFYIIGNDRVAYFQISLSIL